MPAVSIRLNLKNSKHITDTLRELAKSVEDMTPVNRSIAEYMANAARLRISRDKRAPGGEKWEALHDITNKLRAQNLEEKIANNEHQKGRYYVPGDILYQSGELYNSIKVGFVTGKSWQVVSDSPHASYMQRGVERTGGMIPGRSIEARPFFGFSDTNKREILKRMTTFLKDAIAKNKG